MGHPGKSYGTICGGEEASYGMVKIPMTPQTDVAKIKKK